MLYLVYAADFRKIPRNSNDLNERAFNFLFAKTPINFWNFINPQAVGMDSGVQFSLSNFLEDILQPKSSKTSPTSNLGP